ncbi:MAG: BREX system ATP-binding domain-containing protein [Candidatus Bruticola sp.]
MPNIFESEPEACPSEFLASEIIERMGALGLPPERGIEFVTVGLDKPLKVLDDHYLRAMQQGRRGSAFKLIRGSFGSGKTHFLTCLRNLAWKRGFLASVVELSLKECSFGDSAAIYRALADRAAVAPNSSDDFDNIVGINAVIRSWALNVNDQAERNRWLNKAKISRFDNNNYRLVFIHLVKSLWEGDESTAEACEMWILGHPVKKLKIGNITIPEYICRQNASSMLASLVQAAVLLGYSGVAALFDEVDRIASGTKREKKDVVDNMRQIVDMCGSRRLPGFFWAFAVPPEFISDVVAEYPALQQRLNSPMPFSASSPQVPTIDVTDSGLSPEEFFTALGRKILQTASIAWNWQYNRNTQDNNLELLVGNYLAMNFDAGQRRNFVKQWIAVLQSEYSCGEGTTDVEAVGRQQDNVEIMESEDFADF